MQLTLRIVCPFIERMGLFQPVGFCSWIGRVVDDVSKLAVSSSGHLFNFLPT